MEIKTSSFNGRRLRAAREYHALTIGELANEIGVTNQAISQFENNKTEPKTETLFAICNVLGFPRDYFFQENKNNTTISNTYFRSLSNTSKKERKAQVEKVKLLTQVYEGITAYIRFPEFNLELVQTADELDVEEMAKYVREKWELGNDPIGNLIDVMESHGVIIVNSFDNSSKIDAYSHVEVKCKVVIPLIVLGEEKNFFRQQFNAAHELGHILTDGIFDLENMSKAQYRDMEKLMNHFAGALLVPKNLLQVDLMTKAKKELNYYIELKKKYKVSAQALIVRAYQIGSITVNQYQYLMKQISWKQYKSVEPLDKNFPAFKPRYIKEAMRRIFEQQNVTPTQFMEHLQKLKLSLHMSMVEELLDLGEGYFTKYGEPAQSKVLLMNVD